MVLTSAHTLIAIDPGSTAGVAVFRGGELHLARKLHAESNPLTSRFCTICRANNCLHREDALLLQAQGLKDLPLPHVVVLERPEYWATGKAGMPQILRLSLTAGFLAGALMGRGPTEWLTYEPRAWKGVLPKEHHQPYILACLREDERLRLPLLPRSGHFQPDVLDACGLGLFALGRLAQPLVSPLDFAKRVVTPPQRGKRKRKPLQQGSLQLAQGQE